jgi:hypothetical protein
MAEHAHARRTIAARQAIFIPGFDADSPGMASRPSWIVVGKDLSRRSR